MSLAETQATAPVVPFDEMLLPDGSPRPTHADMHSTLAAMGAAPADGPRAAHPDLG